MASFGENIFVVMEGCVYPKSAEVPKGVGIVAKTPKITPTPDSERSYTLKDVRLPDIEIECIRCERVDSLERKAAVAKFGASMSFADATRWVATVSAIPTATSARCGFDVSSRPMQMARRPTSLQEAGNRGLGEDRLRTAGILPDLNLFV